jgi:acetyl esterase/lipase
MGMSIHMELNLPRLTQALTGALILTAGLLAGCSDDSVSAGPGDKDGKSLVVEAITVATGDNETVSGLLGYMKGTQPTRLVVFCHGYGHTVEGSWRHHVERTVREDTAVITVNYRDNLAFPVLKGAQDTIAATLLAKARFPSVETVYLLGISMGGAISGTAITESMEVTEDGTSLYHYWVDVEGVSMLHETWGAAKAIGHDAAEQIEDDAGGMPMDVPEEYVRRSPALRTQEMAEGGLRAAVVVHGFNDGLVPYNQGREMAQALLAAGIPVQMFNVVRDSDGQTSGTTGTGAIFGAVTGEDPNDTFGLNLSGHGTESDYGHPVIRTGFEQLELLLDGAYDETLPYDEWFVDDGG